MYSTTNNPPLEVHPHTNNKLMQNSENFDLDVRFGFLKKYVDEKSMSTQNFHITRCCFSKNFNQFIECISIE